MSNAFITRRGGGSGGFKSTLTVQPAKDGVVTVIKSDPTKRYDKPAIANENIIFENLEEGKWKILLSRQVTLTMTIKAAGNLTLSNADFQESHEYKERKISTGVWEIKIENDEQTTVQIINLTGDTSIQVNYFSAKITVTYPAESQCICKNGNVILTDINDTTSEKTVTFYVPNGGTWTLTAIASDESGRSNSKNIKDVNDGDDIENVKLAYELVLLSATSGLAGGYSLSGTYISPAINVSDYSTLEITGHVTWMNYDYGLSVGLALDPSALSSTNAPSGEVNFIYSASEETKSISLQGLSGDMYLGFWWNIGYSNAALSMVDISCHCYILLTFFQIRCGIFWPIHIFGRIAPLHRLNLSVRRDFKISTPCMSRAICTLSSIRD